MSLAFDFSLDKPGFSFKVAGNFNQKVTGVFGPSGAGKTTLLHLLAGIERPRQGYLKWRGTPLLDCSSNRWTPPHLRGMAVVFQEARLFPHLTVANNLRYGEAHLPLDARRFHFSDIVDMLGLGKLVTKKAHLLSGGESQRVALGRALLSSPHVLLLDEPLSALDTNLHGQILPFLQKIKRDMGIPMVYVSHDLGSMLQLADEIMVLEQGRSLGQGAFLDLVQDKRISSVMGDHGLLNVLQAKVLGRDDMTDLLLLEIHHHGEKALAAQSWHAPIWDLEPGQHIQIGIRPEDIALANQVVPQVSIQNQIPGVVDKLVDHGSRTLCLVDVGVPLLVEITPHSAETLRLRSGKPVYLLFKTRALQCMGSSR